MAAKYKIWSNNLFVPLQDTELEWFREQLRDHELSIFAPKDNGREGASAEALSVADIAFGSPDAEAIMRYPNLEWVHLSTAGYTAYDRADLRQILTERGTVLTNSSSVYDEPCAQHLLAMMMALGRGLLPALDEQRGSRQWKMLQFRPTLPLLNGQTAVLLGYGAIARRLAELLRPLEMNLIGVRRNIRGDETIEMVTEANISDILPRADHVVNILPASAETENFINAEQIGLMKNGAILYNIGRGSTVDQSALIKALDSGLLAAAYLDVTVPEPLPTDHPLWTTKNCYITPHTAGGHSTEKERQLKHFLSNLERFASGEELLNRIV